MFATHVILRAIPRVARRNPRRAVLRGASRTAPGRHPGGPTTHLSTPRTVKRRGIVWLGAALLAAMLQADL
jgi:hypothetical protein